MIAHSAWPLIPEPLMTLDPWSIQTVPTAQRTTPIPARTHIVGSILDSSPAASSLLRRWYFLETQLSLRLVDRHDVAEHWPLYCGDGNGRRAEYCGELLEAINGDPTGTFWEVSSCDPPRSGGHFSTTPRDVTRFHSDAQPARS